MGYFPAVQYCLTIASEGVVTVCSSTALTDGFGCVGNQHTVRHLEDVLASMYSCRLLTRHLSLKVIFLQYLLVFGHLNFFCLTSGSLPLTFVPSGYSLDFNGLHFNKNWKNGRVLKLLMYTLCLYIYL